MSSLPPDGFADDNGPPDGFADQPSESPWYQKASDSIKSVGTSLEPILRPISVAMQRENQSQFGSPQQLLQSVPGMVNRGSDYLGQRTAESLVQNGFNAAPLFSPATKIPVNPMVAAGIGTAVAMAPDVLMSFANPESGGARAKFIGSQDMGRGFPRENLFNLENAGNRTGSTVMSQTLKDLGVPNPLERVGNEYAQNKALTALGTPKRLLKSPQMVEKAQGHAQTLLDQGLIKPFRGTQGMTDELSNLEASSGQQIGDILGTLGDKGKVFDPQSAINDINQLRPVSKSTGQILRGGAYDKINNKIDEAIATVQAHLPQVPGGGTMSKSLSFQEANDLKGVLQGLANYASNKDATLLDKVIAGKFRQSVDNSLEEAANQIGDPNLAQQFSKAKRTYAATQFAKDPLYNKLSSELTNKKISLTDWILGSASLATGNPLTAALEVGLKKGIEKFGPSTQAYISNKLSKTPKILGLANKSYGITRPFQDNNILTEDKALEYLSIAGNDPNKARQMALRDGYEIPSQ
jgi:hypothetical protein